MPTVLDDQPDVAAGLGRWSPLRVLLVVVVLGLVAMWGYVLYLALGPGRADSPDTLSDPAFGIAAEVRCQQALDEVAELPAAGEARSLPERAEIIDVATGRFAAMVEDLDMIVPSGEDGELVELWLADWRTYLDDRREHADALASGDDRRFQVSARHNEQITEYIDGFAADNDMPACATPLDV